MFSKKSDDFLYFKHYLINYCKFLFDYFNSYLYPLTWWVNWAAHIKGKYIKDDF